MEKTSKIGDYPPKGTRKGAGRGQKKGTGNDCRSVKYNHPHARQSLMS